ncbi:hypothetical protein BHYA_0190g00200 [Botrytis hyacinthi]|uniref:Uncharacterized protein n=1 Tax=Botrytis hyacinthi TaxID=278943 RepID=A0A4Z1GGP7_9HELO|nr:hypothetical protein BHYA_0190g00200 [Botrytis hyacinthi]
MPEKESKALPKMNISSAWTLLQKVSTLVNNLSKSQEEAQLSRNTDSQAVDKLKNKVKSLENELKGTDQAARERDLSFEVTSTGPHMRVVKTGVLETERITTTSER